MVSHGTFQHTLFKQCAHRPYRRIYELSWEKLSRPGNKFRPASIQRSEALSSNFLKVAMLSELRPAASRFTGSSGNNWLFEHTLLTQPLLFPTCSFFIFYYYLNLTTYEQKKKENKQFAFHCYSCLKLYKTSIITQLRLYLWGEDEVLTLVWGGAGMHCDNALISQQRTIITQPFSLFCSLFLFLCLPLSPHWFRRCSYRPSCQSEGY